MGLMNQLQGVWCERAVCPLGGHGGGDAPGGPALYGLESGDSIARL